MILGVFRKSGRALGLLKQPVIFHGYQAANDETSAGNH